MSDAGAAYEWAVSEGIPNLGPITVTPVSRFFLILDPDATVVQLHEFHDGQERVAELFPTGT